MFPYDSVISYLFRHLTEAFTTYVPSDIGRQHTENTKIDNNFGKMLKPPILRCNIPKSEFAMDLICTPKHSHNPGQEHTPLISLIKRAPF